MSISGAGFSGYLVLWDDLKQARKEDIVLGKTARLLDTGLRRQGNRNIKSAGCRLLYTTIRNGERDSGNSSKKSYAGDILVYNHARYIISDRNLYIDGIASASCSSLSHRMSVPESVVLEQQRFDSRDRPLRLGRLLD
jgi:hypothetical protein